MPAPTPQQKKILAQARLWLGTPWHHQATQCGVGTDCLGLVRGVYEALFDVTVHDLPAYPRYVQAGSEETILSLAHQYLTPLSQSADSPPPASVGVFRMRPRYPARHLAIFGERETMIHALTYHCVAERPYTSWWQKRCVALFAFPKTAPQRKGRV